MGGGTWACNNKTTGFPNKAPVFIQLGLRDYTFPITKCVVLHVFANIIGWNSNIADSADKSWMNIRLGRLIRERLRGD